MTNPMPDCIAVCKNVSIQLQPTNLKGGGWMADFTVFEEQGTRLVTMPYHGKNAYPTRDEAKRAALDSALRIVNGLLDW